MNGLTRSRQTSAVKVAALGMVEASPEVIAELRKNPGTWSAGSEPPATHLKLVDEQAVLATVALLRAIDRAAWQSRSFAEWAVVAAPRFLGRMRGSAAIGRYLRLGPRALSPIVIPTLSLHSVSGVVSLILQSHGSNFGISGEHSHVSEALVTGLALQHNSKLPGVWVILTGWDPEPIPNDQGQLTNSITGYGIAMALIDETAPEPGMKLGYDPTPTGLPAAPITIGELARALQNPETMVPWNCPVDGGGIITLERSMQERSPAA